MSSQPLRARRNTWYLLPIFFHIIGGAIAFFAIRHDDPKKARRCLVLGAILFAINIVIGLSVGMSLSSPDNLFGQMTDESQIEMKFQTDSVEIHLNDKAQFLAVKWDPIIIPAENVVTVHDQIPKQSVKDLRIPGTYVPNVVKAGTYVTKDASKEFWFTKNGKDRIITIELENHEYNRIVLESHKSNEWADSMNLLISK